jgi:hypothetical protein
MMEEKELSELPSKPGMGGPNFSEFKIG